MNIFKELIKLKEEYADKLKQAKWGGYEEEIKKYKEQLNMIVMLLKVKEEKWEITAKAREQVDYILDNGIKKAMDKFGKNEEALRKLFTRYSNKFEEKVGKTTIPLIKQGRIEEALLQFKMSWGILNLNDLFVSDLWNKLDEKKMQNDIKVKLSDCKDELKLLRLYSKSMLAEQMKGVDENNLYGLLKFLNSETTVYNREKMLIMQFLNGEVSYSELLQQLKELGS